MSLFATEAWAQGTDGIASSSIIQFVPFILIFVVFYFLIIRPQQKKQKSHQKMLSNLNKGDQIVTAAGIHGTVTKLGEDIITVEIADKVRIQIDRSQVARLVKASNAKEDFSSEKEAATSS